MTDDICGRIIGDVRKLALIFGQQGVDERRLEHALEDYKSIPLKLFGRLHPNRSLGLAKFQQ